MGTVKKFAPIQLPQSRDELHRWIHRQLHVPAGLESALWSAIDSVLTRHQELWEQSKNDAVHAVSASLAGEMARLRVELLAKDATVSSISRLAAALVERADTLRYDAKREAAGHPRWERVAIKRGELVTLGSSSRK